MKNPKESYIAFPQNTIRILQETDFQFRKQFGQNFLIDLHVLDKIIAAGEVGPDDVCIEIGPGIGSLTQFIAEEAGRVYAVEIDRRLIPILETNLAGYQNLTVAEGDFLELDLPAFLEEYGIDKPVKVIANLPYYITTPIIMQLFESGIPLDRIVVMVQEEVARRMQAGPGTKDYGALSLAVQYYATAEISAFVPQNCFMPRPGVGSAVITLKRLETPRVSVAHPKQMFAIIKAAFGQRRKTLTNSLSGSPEFSISKENAAALVERAGLDPLIRGEALQLEDFAKLSDLWDAMKAEAAGEGAQATEA